MNALSYFCIYAIGFLLTYKYVIGYFLSDVEHYNCPYTRQATAITCGLIWIIFWPLTLFVPVPDND